MPASNAALLLNAEGVFTAVLAWFAFRENFDRRVATGMAAIVAGAVVLSWTPEVSLANLWPALVILGACFAWGVDNNLTRKVSLTDATLMGTARTAAYFSIAPFLALYSPLSSWASRSIHPC